MQNLEKLIEEGAFLCNPPATEEAILEAEQKLSAIIPNLKIPSDYVNFLKKNNGCFLQASYYFVVEGITDEYGDKISTFNSTQELPLRFINQQGADGYEIYNNHTQQMEIFYFWSDEVLTIGVAHLRGILLIGYKEHNYNQIFYIESPDYDTYPTLTKIADSLDEFLGMMKKREDE
jgi:hypothetical protein